MERDVSLPGGMSAWLSPYSWNFLIRKGGESIEAAAGSQISRDLRVCNVVSRQIHFAHPKKSGWLSLKAIQFLIR